MPKAKTELPKYPIGSMVKLKGGTFGEITKILQTREGYYFYMDETEDPFPVTDVLESYVKEAPRRRRVKKDNEPQAVPM